MRWSEIHRDTLERKREAAVHHGGFDAVTTFTNGRVGQSYSGKGRESVGEINLDLNNPGIYTQQGTNELKSMFGDGKTFEFPKPRRLVETIIALATESGDLVLDSFAGSVEGILDEPGPVFVWLKVHPEIENVPIGARAQWRKRSQVQVVQDLKRELGIPV